MHLHEHTQDKGHIHTNTTNEKKLFVAIFLNAVITTAQIIGGLISGSLALLSDAFHNLSDVMALTVSYFALKISKKGANETKTYGYKRAEILAALLNIVVLVIICFFIIYTAVKRFYAPVQINSSLMIIVTLIGLLGNGISVLMLFTEAKKNINMKSAFLHLLGDTFSSVAVLIVAIILHFYKFLFLDAAISILISLYIIKESFTILAESINILMQATPAGLNTKTIIARLIAEKDLDILDIHHIHVWAVSQDDIVMDAHVVVKKEIGLREIDSKIIKINDILECDFGITHSTLQFETEEFKHEKTCVL
ncbi:MAG: cation diffusion facilitator family transporter [bacterium]